MSLPPIFKDNLKASLKSKLNKYGKIEIEDEYEDFLGGFHSIFWDFKIVSKRYKVNILLEIESKRPDPIHNLLKTFMWFEQEQPCDHFILLQAFDDHYTLEDKPSLQMCDFINTKIRSKYKNLTYAAKNISWLREAQLQRNRHRGEVCDRIATLVDRLLAVKKKQTERG